MDAFEKVFQHRPEYRIIVCITCRFAVVPDQVQTHLQKGHPKVSASSRRSIVQICQNLSEVARTVEEVAFPSPGEERIPGLPTYEDGMRCTAIDHAGIQCTYICRGKTFGIQKHCTESHGWVNSQKRGGHSRAKSVHSANRMWHEGQACQRFFKTGKWQRYFQVKARAREPTTSQAGQRDERAEQMLAEMDAAIEAAQSQRKIDGSANRYVANPWLSFTK